MGPQHTKAIRGRILKINDFRDSLRFVCEMEQGKEPLRLDKVNQVLALFGAEIAHAKISESVFEIKCF